MPWTMPQTNSVASTTPTMKKKQPFANISLICCMAVTNKYNIFLKGLMYKNITIRYFSMVF